MPPQRTREIDANEEWGDYITALMKIKDVSGNAMADAIGVTASTTNLWKRGTLPRVQTVRAIAEYFNRPVTEVMIRAGFLTYEDLHEKKPDSVELALLPDEELLAEVARRMGHHGGKQEKPSGDEEATAKAPKTRKGSGQHERSHVRP